MDSVPNHNYGLTVNWTGNRGDGTSGPGDYDRDHIVSAPGRPELHASADPSFRGDPQRWNPEEMLVASLSSCHMLWYLGLAAASGVIVTDYVDSPTGVMTEQSDGSGQFVEVTLAPIVTVADPSMTHRAEELHTSAAAKCFIARSVNLPVRHTPTTEVAS
ncbi:putative redox protein [Rhodococcus sp. AW25M09]|uniref:OsmC family protein n=1 Tax=Rhodococcus sp. AW25M09 TaxID=1268303 RepID=UPI0002AC4581|nr:OsmC family protein [Rhodococcus sp. AW25M09]CCQ16524.1 putative redox protein [Rhodococcus sp. AW25M09]